MKINQDNRQALLNQWITKKITTNYEIYQLNVDASFRRYFRVNIHNSNEPFSSMVLMDAPPEFEDCQSYINVNHIMHLANLNVPKIYYQDLNQGFLALSDFGDFSYQNYIKANPQSANKLYQLALDALIKIQLSSHPNHFPLYDRKKISDELELFPTWFLNKHLQAKYDRNELTNLFNKLIDRYLSYPKVLVHRDYHARNLMVIENNQTIDEQNTPGILDFQDAVLGPITYDLVSIFRDAYIEWDEEVIMDWLKRYRQQAKEHNLPVASDFTQFHLDFDYMILQRHLKVLGIFARLYYRDHKANYLEYLPLVFRYCQTIAKRYRELKFLAKLFDQIEARILPS